MPIADLSTLINATAQNLSQFKGLSFAYNLIGGAPSIAGYTALIKANNDSNFGAGAGTTFNDENVYINTLNALYQGNAAAKSAFDGIVSSGATLSDKLELVYNNLIPAGARTDAGLAYFKSQAAFYEARAIELGVAGANGAALVAYAGLSKIAVDNDIGGLGDTVNDLIAAVNNGTAVLPEDGAVFTALEAADGTQFDDDDVVVTAPFETFTLTTGIDAGAKFTGGTGDDLFVGDAASTSAADQLNGAGGNDTLSLFGTTTLPSISAIENIVVNNSTGNLNTASQADVKSVTLKDTAVTDASPTYTLSASQTLSLENVTDGDADNTDGVEVASAASVTSQTVNLNKVGDVAAAGIDVNVDINGTGVDTLTLNSMTNASRISVENSGGALKTLNVGGDAKLTIDANVPGATTINSTNTAGLVASTAVATATGLTITGAAGAESITLAQAAGANALSSKVAVDLGTGDDTLSITNLTAAANIQAGATFKGGEGSDTLNVRDGAVIDATTGAQFTGFEVLDVAGGTGTYNASFLAAGNTITKLAVSADLAAGVTVTNLPEAAGVEFGATTTSGLTVNQKDAGAGSPDDVIGVTIDGKTAITVASVDLNDIETVNVASKSAGTSITHVATALVADEATKMSVDASTAGLTITNLEADAVVLFDASASAKAVSVTTGADTFNATSGVAFNLGQAADTIVLTGANTSAGAATDLDFIVTGNGLGDTITLSAAGQVEHVKYLAQSDSTAADFDKVGNFTTTEDKLDLKAFGFTGTADDAVLTVAAGVTLNAAGDIEVSAAAAGNFFNDAGIDRGVAEAVVGANLYVFVDVNKDGDFSADADMVVELTGINAAGFAVGDVIFA